jgi:hypothetical protein
MTYKDMNGQINAIYKQHKAEHGVLEVTGLKMFVDVEKEGSRPEFNATFDLVTP